MKNRIRRQILTKSCPLSIAVPVLYCSCIAEDSKSTLGFAYQGNQQLLSFSLLQIARSGEIAGVERYKARPTEANQIEMLNRHPGTVQINGRPGMYESSQELQQHLIDSMWLFDHMK